jgi:hypothetical protein
MQASNLNMGDPIEIRGDECPGLQDLFHEHRRWRAAIDGALSGSYATVTVDDIEHPRVARINTTNTSLFGGDPEHPVAAELLRSVPNSVLPDNDQWEQSVLRVLAGRADLFRRRDYDSGTLDPSRLRDLQDSLSSDFRLVFMDLEETRRVRNDIGSLCLGSFSSPEEFVRHGIGFSILQGDRAVSAATSADASSEEIGIQITTHEAFRRRGLATVVSAALILHCLNDQINPSWSAAHSWSCDLAEKLGYSTSEEYNHYIVRQSE